ncbi:MAG: SUMF1/EgtB/PvdO family nonheme iron enzyme [Bacteroidota bacterium]
MKKKKILKIAIMIVVLISGFSWNLRANNVKVDTQPVVCNANFAQDYAFVKFDMSWDNSWRDATNWDAAWVFVKYKVGANGAWNHAYLSTNNAHYNVVTDNGVPAQFSAGTTNISGNDRGMGAFIFRSGNGNGSINWDKIMLRWNYGENGVGDNDTVTVKVFAVEMCYVPQGSFWVGNDTLQEYNAFRTYGGVNPAPFNITSQASVPIGPVAGQLYWTYSTGPNSGVASGSTNALYPTGYNAFYCMKYEISQEQYVDFLNTLTRTQQARRVQTNIAIGVTVPATTFVMSNTVAMASRNAIRCPAAIDANAPVTFFCDYNSNAIGNEADDGQTIACNDFGWIDMAPYLDWAGLRPMTELEFEKSCRGTAAPVAGEGAWGTSLINKLVGVISTAQESELASTNPTNCHTCSGWNTGPVRCGLFALVATNREGSGGSFYGIMDLSGNLWERLITIGNAQGQSFDAINGDGLLAANGDHDVTNWPGQAGTGTGIRGGGYSIGVASLNWHTSSRQTAANGSPIRAVSWGGRGVRTAQ